MTIENIRPAMRLDVYSHGIKATQFDDHGQKALNTYCARRFGQQGLVKVSRHSFRKEIVKTFAAATADRTEYRVHRNVLEDLLQGMDHFSIHPSRIEVVHHPLYVPKTEIFIQKDLRPLREYQIPQVEYMVAPGTIKVTTLQTGRGKSRIFLESVKEIQQRTALVIQAKYIEKWIEDYNGFFETSKGDLMVVQGGKDLSSLIHLAKANELTAKFIIISNKTIYDFIKTYNVMKSDSPYSIPPEKFYETLQVGIRGIDEVHQDYHLNFKQDLYSHVPKTISMSATLESDDAFLNRMYLINFPKILRAPEVEYDRYIMVVGLWYSIDRYMLDRFIRFKNAKKQYSHTEFEKSIMRRPQLLRAYIDMIVDIVDTIYLDDRVVGQTALVFCATVKMCGLVRDAVSKKAPNLIVNRYTSDEPFSDLMQADIAITTLQSAGTAIDKPNLAKVLMTTALSSKQANEQAIGRLRRLRDFPDVTPEFYFLSAYEIGKHVEYAEAKKHKLDGKVLSFKEMHTRYRI